MMRNTKVLLRDIGVALYGVAWEAEMARRRGVDPRTVRGWCTGMRAIPDHLWQQLRDEIQIRKLELDELLDQLPK
jgi:hypothetical protein